MEQIFDEQDIHAGEQGKAAEETVLKIQTDKVSFDQLIPILRERIQSDCSGPDSVQDA